VRPAYMLHLVGFGDAARHSRLDHVHHLRQHSSGTALKAPVHAAFYSNRSGTTGCVYNHRPGHSTPPSPA
jgi:hypothetical protein